MRKILSCKLKNLPLEKIELPIGSQIVGVMDVYGEPTLFYHFDMLETKNEVRTIYRVTTGKPVDDSVIDRDYIGSISIANYGIVYHFYTGGDPKEFSKDLGPVADVAIVAKTGGEGSDPLVD